MHRELSNFNVGIHTVNMVILGCMAKHDLVHNYTTSAIKCFIYLVITKITYKEKKHFRTRVVVIMSYGNPTKAARVQLNGHVINRRGEKGRSRRWLSAASFIQKTTEEEEEDQNVHQVR